MFNGLGPTFHEFMTSIRMGDSPILFYGLYDELIGKLIMSSIVMDKAKVMVAHPLPNLTPATVTKSKLWCVNTAKKLGHSAHTCCKIHGKLGNHPSTHVSQDAGTS